MTQPKIRMQRSPALPRPTEAELAILSVLWRLGPATVRDVHDELARYEQTGYTTTLKLLQIMYQKGLVTRNDTQRAHVYSPTLSKQQTQEQLLGDFTRRVFDDSPAQLVLQALGAAKQARPEELAQIKALLDRIEERKDRGEQ
jgi:predicted transcriptional regulator